MNETNKSLPYETLGSRLRELRERNRESLPEVSGAVEIEEKDLVLIESGTDRPSEDILLLLLSHFAVEDEKAAELWQLAGYDKHMHETEHGSDADTSSQSARTQAMMIMIDPRVMYSDSAEVIAGGKGVVLNFSQAAGQQNQPLIVSRVGMSYDQAKTLMGVLHQALYDADNPKRRQLGDGK